mmetsp:Transcript_65872/g.104488  ORF Transcript_65872/g.104488 Transcript_65872/m.104488 type:complete len:938 (+) Transcript_65872:38-2851(+)
MWRCLPDPWCCYPEKWYCIPANQFCCGCSLRFGTGLVILVNLALVVLLLGRTVAALWFPEDYPAVGSLPMQIVLAAFGLASMPFLCLGIHGITRRDEVTLTAYGFYLLLAVGFATYFLVQLGLSMTCSRLPGDAQAVGAYVCGVIEIIDIVLVSVLVLLLIYFIWVVWSQCQDFALGGHTKFSDLEESYGSLQTKRLLEASHNTLQSFEDEGLGATFSSFSGAHGGAGGAGGAGGTGGGAGAVGGIAAGGVAKAKAPSAPPTSAAAVVEEGRKPMTAAERLSGTGSALAKGVGAKAEAVAKPKAKAKMGAMPNRPLPQESMGTAPRQVLNMVSAKPAPATQGGTQGYATSSVGPARAYAKTAAGAVGGEVPKAGPPAVAMGRAMAAGRPAVTMVNGKPVTTITKKYQLVFVTGEVAPFSKTGGLGEAMDGLPIALAAMGHRCMVISPRYDQYAEAWDTGYWGSVTMGGKQESVHFFHTYKQKVDYVFVDHPTFLERVNGQTGSKLYGPEWGKDFADNQARFAYFCKAALKAIQELPLGGAIYGGDCMVVCNDWHSALVPMLIHAEKTTTGKWQNTKTAFLCHNAVFQGRFQREEGLAGIFGVPERYIDSITFKMPLRIGKYNEKITCVNTMAAGLRYCDRALTVSPSYAVECCTDPEKGVELESLFTLGKCTGILNGVKEGVSPSDKNFVTKTMMSCGPFNSTTCDIAKSELKASYRAQNGLTGCTGPLMCFIGRLDSQKGYDLLLESLVEVLEDTEMQVVIVGAGRADLVAQTKAVEKKYPDKFFYAGWMGPERYALLAACDYTLLPSRWEPCGLVQMEAMRLGTLPIVAPTGGLKDTVEDGVNGLWTEKEMTVEAIVDQDSVESISKSLRRASQLFQSEPQKVVKMKQAAMAAAAEYTWSNAALQYEQIFTELGVKDVLNGKTATVTLETDKQVC